MLGALGRLGKRFATRSKWLARRLWLLALAETGFVTWRHWRRLEPEERDRLVRLARKSKGRPSNLSRRERRQVDELLDKMGHLDLLARVASTWLPFGWMSRLATRLFGPRLHLSGRDGSRKPPEVLPAANADGDPGRGDREQADPARVA